MTRAARLRLEVMASTDRDGADAIPAASDLLDQLRASGSNPIVHGFPEGAIIVFDADLRYVSAGGQGLATVGLSREMIEGKTIYEVFPETVVAALEEPYRRALAGEEATLEIEFGDRIFLHRISPLADTDGAVVAGIGFALDITAARRAEQALRTSEERLREERRRLRDAEAIGHSGSWEWDTATDIITWSDGLFAMHELDPAEIHGGYAQASARVHADDMETVDTALEACRQSEEPVQFRYRVARAGDGELRWFDSHARGVFEDGQLVRLVGAVADVTDIVQAEERLSHDALHDSLTGLPNRALLLDRLDAALARSERYGREIAVLFCDLDGFKHVNDSAGHAAGDAVLIEAARRLNTAVREGDTVARVGGDEFVLIAEPWNRAGEDPESALDDLLIDDRFLARQIADRVVQALRAPITVNGVDHRITVSVGVTFPSLLAIDGPGGLLAGEVVEEADAAMYGAKHHGKDRFEIFDGAGTEELAVHK